MQGQNIEAKAIKTENKRPEQNPEKSIEQIVWDSVQKKLKKGEDKSISFDSFSPEKRRALLNLMHGGYVRICRLMVKINEEKRGSEYVASEPRRG